MGRRETALAVLVGAYPRASLQPETVAIYAKLLADVNADALERAVERIAKRSAFFPSIAELRAEIAEERLALPSPSVAAFQLGTGVPRTELHPLVAAARDSAGDRWTWRTATNPAALIRSAVRAYEGLREQAIANDARDLSIAAPDPLALLTPATAGAILRADADEQGAK